MLLQVYTNQVQLKNDEEQLLARIEFIADENGVCQLGDVIKEQAISPKVENKMMSLALNKIRKNGQKVVATTAYAQSWFNNHPEDRDLIAEGSVGYIEQQMAPKEDVQLTVKQKEPESIVPSQKQVKKAAKKGGHKILRGIARLLQLVCAICMIAILYFFVTNAVTSDHLSLIKIMVSGSTEHKIFFGILVGFVVFGIIEFIWIMTRKKIKYEDEVDYIDSGRGLFAFILILAAYFVSIYLFQTYKSDINALQWVEFFVQPLSYVPYISGIGALLCVIRKILGR